MARKAKNPPVEVKDKDIDTVEDSEEVLFGEEDLENSGLRELVDKGKDQGFLTYEDINSMLPEDISDPDQVEETIQMLMDIGIEVLPLIVALKKTPMQPQRLLLILELL